MADPRLIYVVELVDTGGNGSGEKREHLFSFSNKPAACMVAVHWRLQRPSSQHLEVFETEVLDTFQHAYAGRHARRRLSEEEISEGARS